MENCVDGAPASSEVNYQNSGGARGASRVGNGCNGGTQAIPNPCYQANGAVTQVTDSQPVGRLLINSATYTYDGLGRLLGASDPALNGSYAYDGLGWLTLKDGTTFSVSTTHPHQLTSAIGGTVSFVCDAARFHQLRVTFPWIPDER